MKKDDLYIAPVMRLQRLIFLMILAPFLAAGQNLFPNGGFEQYTTCPNYTSQINRCTGWDSCLGTADFFHCGYYANSTLGNYGIPATGDGVIGVIASVPGPFTIPAGRFYGETFRGNLLSTLEPGATYEIKADFLCNPVSWPPPGDCLDIGFYFFKTGNPPQYHPTIPFANPYQAQVGMAANQVPVGSYATFTFSYVADSCYDAVMIGLFSNDSTFGTTCSAAASSFYFDIDNISMRRIADAPLRITTAVSNEPKGCTNDCFRFDGNSSLPVNSWQWSFPGSATPTSDLQNPVNICYPSTGNFDVTLIAGYECSADTILLENYIQINDVPTITISGDSAFPCFGSPISLKANSTATVVWNNGTTGNELEVSLNGTYIATAENECGIVSDTAIVAFENCPCEVFLPNAFTPDASGNNDIFKAEGLCELRDFQLEIYDRWGQRLFITSDINAGWDGRFNGEICPQGIYTATLSWSGYSDQKVKRVRKNSHVALLR